MICIEMTFKVTLILVVISYSQCLHEICKLPIETGPCENWQYRWAYNVLSDQCEKFKFSGCEGNQNNFHSSQQCQAVCRKLNSIIPLKLQRTKNSCEQPIDPGNCYASIPRYYYNTETGNCEQFVYGGCGGNGNNFLTEDECVKKCKSPQGDENELGEGDTARETEDQIEDDDENKKVGYRALKVDPMRKICSLVAETGPCNRRIRRYFYNGLTKKCTQFYYGGCDGNKNNFMSLNECRKACFKSMETYSLKKGYSLAVCRLLPESGPCNEYVTKYYFNTITEQCDTFEYGGCRGNKNRFDTIEDCRITCKAMGNKLDELTSINACKDEPLYQYDIIADCYKFSIVYSYNETSNSCKKFYYSGCGGNRNRFRNKQLCVDTCVRKDIE